MAKARISVESVNGGLKDVNCEEYLRTIHPSRFPLVGSIALRDIVCANREELSADFPNIFDAYNQSVPRVMRRLHRNREIAQYVMHFESWEGVSLRGTHVGLFTAVAGEVDGVEETVGGINVAAWLDRDSVGKGYMERLAPGLAEEVDPDQKLWTVARPDNDHATGLMAAIGMSPIGSPDQYDIGDGVQSNRQLYVATAGDIAQTSRLHVRNKYGA